MPSTISHERGDGVPGDGAPVSEVRGHHDGDECTHQYTSRRLKPMFWGIDRPEWLLLWSGILGAVVSAAVAALVATVVLVRSNRHQIKLSEEAAEKQRAEASRSREQAALAEVLIATEGLIVVVNRNSLEEVKAHWPVLNAAMARWRMELGAGDMEREIAKWPVFLRTAALKGVTGKTSKLNGWEAEFVKLGAGIRLLSSVVLAWPEANLKSREEMREELRVFRVQPERAPA